MSTQLNIKLDARLKDEAELLARQFGLSLSGILRAFLLNFVRLRRIEFSIDSDANTPRDMRGGIIEMELVKAGYDLAYAKKHADAYDAMLRAESENKLIEFS